VVAVRVAQDPDDLSRGLTHEARCQHGFDGVRKGCRGDATRGRLVHLPWYFPPFSSTVGMPVKRRSLSVLKGFKPLATWKGA